MRSSRAVMFLLLDFIVMAFTAHVKQTLPREQNSLFMRLPPFMNAAFKSGHDKEAFPHFVSAGVRDGEQAAETNFSRR